MNRLAAHLESMQSWLHRVREVVVVDSASDDGTVEWLGRNLRHPSIRFLQHPPGLYASWNAGIAAVTAPYTYISTMGDSLDRDGLEHLVAAARSLEADVVISPPRFVAEGKRKVPQHWPIHELIRAVSSSEPWSLPAEIAHAFAVARVPSALLGSAASNLFRTEVLRERPFSTDFGASGDTAWALEHAASVKWVVLPRTLADFLLHEGAASSQPGRLVFMLRLVDLALSGPTGLAQRDPTLGGLERELRVCLQRNLGVRDRWRAERKRGGGMWWLRPVAWRLRSERHAAKSALERVSQATVQRVLAALPSGGVAATSLADA